MADVPLMNNPMTTAEDIIVGGASGAPGRLAKGSNGNVLTVTAGAVGWAAPAGGSTAAWVGVWAVKTSSFPTLTTAIASTLAFDAADQYDTNAFHDPSSSNTRLTVPSGKAGYYQPWAVIGFASNATGRRAANLLLNGGAFGQTYQHMASNGGSTIINFYFPVMNLAVGDYIEVQATQFSGGNLATNAQQFGMYLVGT